MGRHSKNLPESNCKLHGVPYAQVRCPGDAFRIRRPFHSNRTSRRTRSQLSILRSLSKEMGAETFELGSALGRTRSLGGKRLLQFSLRGRVSSDRRRSWLERYG